MDIWCAQNKTLTSGRTFREGAPIGPIYFEMHNSPNDRRRYFDERFSFCRASIALEIVGGDGTEEIGPVARFP